MRYHHLLILPPVFGLRVDDLHLFVPPTPLKNVTSEGTCSSAVDIMAYHRDKMHEYLCRQYLAEEITGNEHLAEERALIDDAGSKNYQNWLERSSTLEDLYRHYEQSTSADAPIGASLPPGNFDGEVTGYAMLGNKQSVAETSGYGAGTSYAVPQYGTKSSNNKSDKGMKLQDLFQLALTAIAFLAFGTFIIEVIMCIMDVKDDKNEMNIVMLRQPDPLLEAVNYYKTDEPPTSRKSRSLRQFLDQLAARATASLDGLEILHKDGGKYLQQALCEANKFSRTMSGKSKIWLPLWSFGMSWIGGRQFTQVYQSPMGMLKFLTASIQGIAGVDCLKIS